MKVVIFPAGPETFASSRIRAHWVAKYWPEAYVHTQGELDPLQYDVFIFQKIFWGNAAEDARRLREMGKIVAWDICEPMWWNYPEQHARMAKGVSFAVACSENLSELTRKELGIPCYFISDRHDPAFHPRTKIHTPTDVLRFVWFGYSGNRFTLNAAVPYLQRLKTLGKRFDLLLIDEHPEVPLTGFPCPVIQKAWDLETFNGLMLQADAALLPAHPEPLGRYKSNNKMTAAAWCGLPAVSGADWEELWSVFSEDHRSAVGKRARALAEERYDVHLSVNEWKDLLKSLGA